MNHLRIGICGSTAHASQYSDAGFDYMEISVVGELMPEKPASDFAAVLNNIRCSSIPCCCANGFLPPDLKVCGDAVDRKRWFSYAENAFARAREVGVETIVFGSGGARRCPEEFSIASASEQILEFLLTIVPLTEKYGVTLVIEPLRKKECNMLTSVAVASTLVSRVNHPNIRLLIDSFHFLSDDLDTEAFFWGLPLITHVHVATVPNRRVPGFEECGLAGFLEILKKGGYRGRISFEGSIDDFKTDAGKCLDYLRNSWNSIS